MTHRRVTVTGRQSRQAVLIPLPVLWANSMCVDGAGGYLSIVSGLLYDATSGHHRWGPRATLLVGAALNTGGYLALWACAAGWASSRWLSMHTHRQNYKTVSIATPPASKTMLPKR